MSRFDEAVAKLEKQMGKKLGDAADPLLVSVRSGAKFSMPGMMNTILNLGLNDATTEGLVQEDRQSALRLRLLSPLHSDVRRSGARHRYGEVRPYLRRAQAQSQSQARYRPERRRPEGHHRRLQKAGAERDRQGLSARSAASSWCCRAMRCSIPGGTRPKPSTTAGWKRSRIRSAPAPTCRPWCSATWATTSATGVGFTRDPGYRRESFLWRISGKCAGRRCGGGYSHAAADCGTGRR